MKIPLEAEFAGNSQTPIPDITEIAIAIFATNLNPTMLSWDFLKFSGIVPGDWELGREPTLNPQIAQVTFQNGASIVAQPGSVAFIEGIGNKDLEALKAPEIACRYVEKLPNAEYQRIAINAKTLIPLSGNQNAARQYISGTLLAPGPWLEFGQAPVQAAINLSYQLDRCLLNLSINEAVLQQPNKPNIPALLFSGSFNYAVASERAQERLTQLEKQIERWKADWEIFRELVYQRFLQGVQRKEETVFPTNLM